MALITTDGIILRNIKFGESSIITDIFTPKYGRITGIAGGVRTGKTKWNRAAFQHGALIQAEIYYHDNKEILRLKDLSLIDPVQFYSLELTHISLITFYVECLLNILPKNLSNPALYHYAKKEIRTLHSDTFMKLRAIKFLLGLMKVAGVGITVPQDKKRKYFDIYSGSFVKHPPSRGQYISPPVSDILIAILKSEELTLQISSSERDHLLDRLLLYMQWHVEGFKPVLSITILKKILHHQ